MNNILKRTHSLLLFFLVLLTSLLTLSSCNTEKSTTDSEDVDSNFISIDDEINNIMVENEEAVLNALDEISESLGIEDVTKELKIASVNEVEGEKFYRVQQYYNNIPVYGNSVVLGVDENGNALGLTSNTSVVQDVDTAPSISLSEAQKSLEEFLEGQKPKDMAFYSPNELVIYTLDDGENILVYNIVASFSIDNGEQRNFECFVDAHTGEVIKLLSLDLYEVVDAEGKDSTGNNRDFIVNQKSSSEYILQDETRNINIYNVGNNPLTYKFYDSNNNPAKTYESIEYVEYLSDGKKVQIVSNSANQWDDSSAITLMANLKDTYDFYDKILSRKGTNGKKNIINGFYNDSMPSMGSYNAYCWGTALYWQNEVLLSFGTDNEISVDTVGHEYTHGVERSISGMEYEGESGAIMEAYSDIFGELVEDYSIDGIMDGDCDWIHGRRNMVDPSKNKYPSKYNGKYFRSIENKLDRHGNSKNDYGGVHTNNTVLSHAAYLMFNGIDGNENMKLNTEMLSKIWYRSLLLLHSDSTFEQCANSVYKSAQSMKGITDEQLSCIVKAFKAVDIDVVTDSCVTTGKGSLLHIKDVNFKYYDNYHLRIVDLKDLRNPQTIVETDINNASGYTLDLEEGNYRVIVSDNDENGSDKEYYRTIRIINDGGIGRFNVPVTIYTDFGGIFAEDFAILSESVITLGELSVIEPEIIPADATNYSIKWLSSDETVATVSLHGEAGIITTLAKGATTITAELTSGGKTITKTTNLRVASQGRDTILVLDISGSMNGTPMTEMKEAAIDFCRELLVDEYNNRVGLIFYDDEIYSTDLTNDLDGLIARIESVDDGGRTNMEEAIATAKVMLDSQGAQDSIKNIVVMADGLPNEGKTSDSGSMQTGFTSYETSVSYANAVIDTAKEAMKNYNMYSLGFFHDLSGDSLTFATELMTQLTNQEDGYHQVEDAENLQFAFGDISEEISDGSKVIINIACPVDVTITYNGETISSAKESFNASTSFGHLQLLGSAQDIKVLSLQPGIEYDVQLTGTDVGKMNYSVNYLDENENVTDSREFVAVPITSTTIISSNTNNTIENMDLNIDENGDGEIDIIWSAKKNESGEITYDTTTEPIEEVVEEETIKEPDEPVQEETGLEAWHVALIVIAVLSVCGLIVVLIVVLGKDKKESDASDEIPVAKDVDNEKEKHISDMEGQDERRTEDKEAISQAAVIVLSGLLAGAEIPLRNQEVIYIGKDPQRANIVFSGDFPNVSRLHCSVSYEEKFNKYFVTDCSKNGTFYAKTKERFLPGKRTSVHAGTILLLGNDKAVIQVK